MNFSLIKLELSIIISYYYSLVNDNIFLKKMNFKQGDAFKLAIVPTFLGGLITNLYILSILLYLDSPEAIWSPIISTFIFLIIVLKIKQGKIKTKKAYIFISLTIIAEVYIHSYYIGWHTGFYYYIFLLPLIFLMQKDWKKWVSFVYNFSTILLTFIAWFIYHESVPVHPAEPEFETLINSFNLGMTGFVTLIIMINFSSILNNTSEVISIANEVLEEKNKEISKQHKNLQFLIKEMHHRVKNNLQIISSLMSLQSSKVENETVANVLIESQRRVNAIALIHQKIYQEDHASQVDFKSYLDDLVYSQKILNSHIDWEVDCKETLLKLDIAVPLGLIISELTTNSIKHAFKEIENPKIWVSLKNDSDEFRLTVRDNGNGLPDKFNIESSSSLGHEIIVSLVEQIDAKLETDNSNGAIFNISFSV